MQTVSVIIPTRVLPERVALLKRALTSVLTQDNVRVIPLVIINGRHRDEALATELRADRRLRVITLDHADLPAALQAGRKMVDTAWFSELDDDDILLPNALALRVRALQDASGFDAVVTNGLVRDGTADSLAFSDILSVERDPLQVLLRTNWLLPGSWLCRTDKVASDIFDTMPRFLECTYMALRLAIDYQTRFLSSPTVVYHTETPLSESKSLDYLLGQPPALRRLLALQLPKTFRNNLRRKLGEACHDNASYYATQDHLAKAWNWHLQSLCEPGGWRYLSFTARLLYGAFAR